MLLHRLNQRLHGCPSTGSQQPASTQRRAPSTVLVAGVTGQTARQPVRAATRTPPSTSQLLLGTAAVRVWQPTTPGATRLAICSPAQRTAGGDGATGQTAVLCVAPGITHLCSPYQRSGTTEVQTAKRPTTRPEMPPAMSSPAQWRVLAAGALGRVVMHHAAVATRRPLTMSQRLPCGVGQNVWLPITACVFRRAMRNTVLLTA